MLRFNEIRLGAVAYLEGAAIRTEQGIWHPPHMTPPDIPHPFVCIVTTDGCSAWLGMTSKPYTSTGRRRFRVQAEWRVGGTIGWRTRKMFVHDHRAPFCGSDDAFVRVAASERLYLSDRPRITPAGMAAILAEVERHAPLSKYVGIMESMVYPAGPGLAELTP